MEENSPPIETSSSVVLGKRANRSLGESCMISQQLRYGWGIFKADFLQRLHKPQFLLACLCLLLIMQGFTVNGILPASVSHLEKRFHMSSAEMGFMNSVFDAGVVIMLLPISHYASNGHKGRWIGYGALMIGFGSLVMTLPHFLSKPYTYGQPQPEQRCIGSDTNTVFSNVSKNENCPDQDVMTRWNFLFYIGSLMFGAGSSPLFTVAIAYMDENVSQRLSATYIGIYTVNIIIGPCLGYAGAAGLARYYGDMDKVNPETVPMTPEDSRWYGAWWIGVASGGLISCILAIPIFGFARELPGSAKLREEDQDEAHHVSVSLHASISKHSWSQFKHGLKVITRNPTYIGLILEQCATIFVVGGLGQFATKYLETQFSMTTTIAAAAAAATAIPPSLIGNVIGTYIQRRMKLKCRGNMILSIMATSFATVFWLIFWITCDTRKFAGLTSIYNGSIPLDDQVAEFCNGDCGCKLDRFQPTCYVNQGVSFFSKCHAGCPPAVTNMTVNVTDCLCTGSGTMVSQLCDSDCTMRTYMPFLAGFGLLAMAVNLKRNPVQQAILRCVPFDMRNFALALGWIPMRMLGAIPSGPAMGSIFNSACVLWQENCGKKEVCILYDNARLATYLQLAGVVGFAVAYLALVFAWKKYRTPPNAEPAIKSDHTILEEALRSSWQDPVVEP